MLKNSFNFTLHNELKREKNFVLSSRTVHYLTIFLKFNWVYLFYEHFFYRMTTIFLVSYCLYKMFKMILGISNQIYFMVSKKLTVMVLSMFYVRCFKVFSTSIHNSVLTLFGSVTCYMVMFWNLSVYCEEKKSLIHMWFNKLQDLF